MKKALSIIIIISIFSINNTFSYDSSFSDQIIINKLVTKFNKKLSNKSISYKIKIKEILYDAKKNSIKDERLSYILNETLKNLNLYDYKNDYLNHYDQYNIDYNKIQNTWLSWHNHERGNLNLDLYSYDDRLNNTSYQWSQYQSSVNTMTHERTFWDWYYNYPIIEKWFQDRLVKCEVSWWVTSSESIAKYWYYCSDENCTDKIVESLREIFILYMAEKWLNYPANAHYKSIIHQNLKKIWLWLYITKTDETNYYEYYVTTHYCTKFTN